MKIKLMPADEGMLLITEMIKTNYLEQVTGVNKSIISKGKRHCPNNGQPFFYKKKHIEKFNRAIKEIAEKLQEERITKGGVKAQLERLRTIVCLPYLFQKVMKKNKSWQSHRLSQSATLKKNGAIYTMLNHFSDKDVKEINDAVKKITDTLTSIQLTDKHEGEIKPCNNDKKV